MGSPSVKAKQVDVDVDDDDTERRLHEASDPYGFTGYNDASRRQIGLVGKQETFLLQLPHHRKCLDLHICLNESVPVPVAAYNSSARQRKEQASGSRHSLLLAVPHFKLTPEQRMNCHSPLTSFSCINVNRALTLR